MSTRGYFGIQTLGIGGDPSTRGEEGHRPYDWARLTSTSTNWHDINFRD